MESVDRLRERFEGEVLSWRMTSEDFAEIDSMLRDIEREHEMALKTDADSTSYQLGYMAGRAAVMREHNGLKKAVAGREEVEMFGVRYAPLQVDRDGVAIRHGDVMEWPDGKTFVVVGIGDGTLFYVEDDDGTPVVEWTSVSTKRHHRKPTVEDVLREMLNAWGELPSNATNEAIIAEYAARLRTAE